MSVIDWLWRFLPDRCAVWACDHFGVRGNENIIDGTLMCDNCSARYRKRQDAIAAMITARDVLLFRHEACGYVAEDVRTAIHMLDIALGEPLTSLKCVGDAQ
jgi:hypothetical protein